MTDTSNLLLGLYEYSRTFLTYTHLVAQTVLELSTGQVFIHSKKHEHIPLVIMTAVL